MRKEKNPPVDKLGLSIKVVTLITAVVKLGILVAPYIPL